MGAYGNIEKNKSPVGNSSILVCRRDYLIYLLSKLTPSNSVGRDTWRLEIHKTLASLHNSELCKVLCSFSTGYGAPIGLTGCMYCTAAYVSAVLLSLQGAVFCYLFSGFLGCIQSGNPLSSFGVTVSSGCNNWKQAEWSLNLSLIQTFESKGLRSCNVKKIYREILLAI